MLNEEQLITKAEKIKKRLKIFKLLFRNSITIGPAIMAKLPNHIGCFVTNVVNGVAVLVGQPAASYIVKIGWHLYSLFT